MRSLFMKVALVVAMALGVSLSALPTASATAATTAAGCPDGVCSSKYLNYSGQQQINGYYCGPAATRVALSVRLINVPTQSSLAASLGTTVNGTDHISQVTTVLRNYVGGWYETKIIDGDYATQAQINLLVADVRLNINNAFPIVANVVGYAYDTNGGYHSYSGGHYLTVVGYEQGANISVIYDPAQGVQYKMETWRLANWIAGRGYSA
ncbi:C39 family peptidase [Actinokineospora cianjurensis]|uniref:Peptidase C39-like protein n=1 Tax=Actinokineospora cianjurensis TaxID=585224 RepID=A0A421BC55_9PSEU|nr:C39 family peptidase [Actinokineospora cianjurensis]RLK61954.1 peptidase C39-like protein [Actinokineospora cianjurensis]